MMEYTYLSQIKSPRDLKKLNTDELASLCAEIRDVILHTVSANGGHLASNLGAVELTVALHYVFDAPDDAIVFDVGHQSYTHKLLTGRFDRFSTLRTEGGLSGFQRPNESEYDPFVSGHSSTAISSAYGLLNGKQLLGQKGRTIAVVGDGAMSGGMVYEAMNHAGKDHSNLIIILNDNKMSISRNVGALARYLSVVRQKQSYFNFKRDLKTFLSHVPLFGNLIKNKLADSKDMLKHRLYYNSNIFEGFGFKYMGPTDGHDLARLIILFQEAKNENRPVVLHLRTQKGRGYAPAEQDPSSYHGIGSFDLEKGAGEKRFDFSAAFGDELIKMAQDDDRVCAVTAAMPEGTGLVPFSNAFPKRFFDVGIAEGHAVTFCAGLAKAGMKPYFAVYSSFLQRAVDQVIHDVAIAGLNVTLCVDRAGFVGADGETHQGLLDYSIFSSVPNVTVYAPSNYAELRRDLRKTLAGNGLQIIRYPRGTEEMITCDIPCTDEPYQVIGQGETTVVTYGDEVANVMRALLENPSCELLKLNRIYPIDDGALEHLIHQKSVIVCENVQREGGVGQKIAGTLCEHGFTGKIFIRAVDGFVPAADTKRDFEKFGLDDRSICELLRRNQ